MSQLTLQNEVWEGVSDFTSKKAKQMFDEEAELRKLQEQQDQKYEQSRNRHKLDDDGQIDLGDDELSLYASLRKCGSICKRSAHCKECLDGGKSYEEAFLEVTKTKYFCQIRYCSNPDCKCCTFARNMGMLNEIERFKNTRMLMHFSFGFEAIPVGEYSENYGKHKKRHDDVINRWLKKMRKLRWQLDGIEVIDFSFKTPTMVFPHYHIAFTPVASNKRRQFLIDCHAVRKRMIARMRIHTPFSIKYFKMAKKESIFAYFSIRACGLYKYQETIQTNYKIPKKQNLKKAILEGKYKFLSDVITPKQYLKNFYNKRLIRTFGKTKLPAQGSNTMDNLVYNCKYHGEKRGNQLKYFVEFEERPYPPPDSIRNLLKKFKNKNEKVHHV